MLQFIERQIVLFDALEDAVFAVTHDLAGLGSLQSLITKVKNHEQQRNFIRQICDYQTRIMLTAHPTQFYPTPVLGILTQLVAALDNNDLKKISLLLLQMGKTSFKQHHKPTPYQEANSLIWYLENIFYAVIPEIQQHIAIMLRDFGYDGKNPNCIDLGFWPGGDRDGNPNVMFTTTLEVARLLKTRILRMYILDLRQLVKKLTFEGVLEKL